MPSWRIDLVAAAPPDASPSSPSRALWRLGTELSRRGHRVRGLYPSEPLTTGPPFEEVERVPVPVVGVRREPHGRARAVARAAAELVDPASDLLLATDEREGGLLLPRESRPGRPLFGLIVHDIQLSLLEEEGGGAPGSVRERLGRWLDRRATRRLEASALARAFAVVVGSESTRARLAELYRLPSAKVHHLPPAVPLPPEMGGREAVRKGFRVPLDVPVVAFAGDRPEREGLPLALEAFRRVRVFFPGARFLVAAPPGRSEPGVSYVGPPEEANTARLLHAADLFLFPTREADPGLLAHEAMRTGVATVVSRHVALEGPGAPGAARVVKEDEAGAYASELAELLADPALRRELGERGRKYADQFSPERMAERLEAVFAPALGR